MQKFIVIFSLLFFFFFSTEAQVSENEMELDPITITASLHPLSLSRTGRNLVVISGSQIKNIPANSIDELLRYLPGLEVQARGPMGAQSDFVIRGGTFQQVLVILDGLRVNDPLTGHFNSYIPITPSEIDRIEILKGAASAIYGTEAVGGVINIISKTFAAKEKSINKKSLQGQLTAGQYGLLNATASAFLQNEKNAFSAGMLSNNASGQQQRGIKGFFNLNTFSASASHQFSDHLNLSIRSSYDDRHFAAQNFYTTFLSDTAEEKVKTFWNQLAVTYKKNKSNFSLQGGYKTAEDNYLFNRSSTANVNKSRLMQLLSTYSYKAGEATVITAGAQFQNRTIRSNDRGNHGVQQSALFLLLEQKVGNNFYINPAARFDWNESSGGEFVPQLNVSYHISTIQLRGSIGKTIREADFTERYNNYNKPLVKSGSIGNPDLVPERSLSYEGGADIFVQQYLKIGATYFKRSQKELIDYVTTPFDQMPRKENLIPTGTYALAKNISSVDTRGFETDVQFSKNLSSKNKIWSTVGFVWLHSTSSEPSPSFYITSHAKFLTNYNFTFTAPRFSFSTNGLYKVRQAKSAAPINASISKDYFLLNAKAEWFVIQRKLSLLVQADNVFNRKYSDLLGSIMPQRWLQFGAKFNL